jgi:hypothetical protein
MTDLAKGGPRTAAIMVAPAAVSSRSLIGWLGDRCAMILEHAGLILVFLAYALVENP